MNENKKVPASRGKSEASTKEILNKEIITSFPDNVKRATGNSRELREAM